MTSHLWLSLALFVFVNSITPGPNNVMLTAAGANFGYRRCLPHMLGISSGVAVMVLLVGIGLGAVFVKVPGAYTALKYLGAAYLIYLTWRIARTRGGAEGERDGRPFTFWEAAAFQWVNPKAWVMAVTAMAVYTDPRTPFLSVLLVSAVFALVNVPCVSTWAGFGVALRGFLSDPARLKWFNIVMGLLLVASLVPMLG